MDVYLVTMPYASIERPSLALGVLKASLLNHGISAKVCYANFAFAETIGLGNYYFLSRSLPRLLMGEWTFSGAAFPDFTPDHERYMLEHAMDPTAAHLQAGEQFLWNIRNQTPAFVETIAQKILAAEPKIVGCSSAFQQHCASLALLRRIKALRPETITLMGGPNCEEMMGYATHQSFDWVDYAVSGEADELLPDLCRDLLRRGRDIPQAELPRGVYGPGLRNNGKDTAPIERIIIQNLDAVPIPLYDDYFEALNSSSLAPRIKPGLIFETSRGCWWGQKNQCTFCGLCGDAYVFRSKSPQRVLDELSALSQTYQNTRFMAADTILNLNYFDTVLPKLTTKPDKYTFFFEVSPNMTKAQVKMMSDAGIRWSQPGIESMHDKLLGLLNKGTRAWKNVQYLKWCLQYGIYASWPILGNVPGDQVEWYREMLDWLPLIVHLQPPSNLWFIRYDRFSRFYKHQEHYQISLQPARVYNYLYPLPPERMADFAYFFEDVSPLAQTRLAERASVLTELYQFIQLWENLYYVSDEVLLRKKVSDQRPVLQMRQENGCWLIQDTRPCAVQNEIVLKGLAADIYLACDAAQTQDQLVKSLRENYNRQVEWQEVQPLVEQLCAQKILLQLDRRFVSLAVTEPCTPLRSFDEDPQGLIILPRTKQRKST